MSQARVQVINEVADEAMGEKNDWTLWLQWCRYLYGDGDMNYGYRFIWKRPDGSLQAARGQARLPSLALIQGLMVKAKNQGWGDYDASTMREF